MRKIGLVICLILLISLFSLVLSSEFALREKFVEENKMKVALAEENNDKNYLIKIDENFDKKLLKNSQKISKTEYKIKLDRKKALEIQKSGYEIREEKLYSLSLQDSVPLIEANTSWNLLSNSLNLTGKFQTVCIIDTGVNYSHSDLSSKYLGGYDYLDFDDDPFDDEGHGTHVTGIAVANGSIKGVAPDSKFVMLKACNASRVCFESALISSINWCVNNASTFNISVISMSLGGGLYSSYCDADDASLASAINSAYAENISVVVATGNDGYANVISSPACIENSTAVTSTNKLGTSVSSFANTWNNPSLVNLGAAGESINSTSYTGTYTLKSGTSMSTPHISGAILILRQYLASINVEKTPLELEELLNSTGMQIYDSSAERYFPVINIYSALLDLDQTNPETNLVSPLNNSESGNSTINFSFNATDWQLKNSSLYIWYSNGTLFNLTDFNISNEINSSSISVYNLDLGIYYWNVLTNDQKSNSDFATNNNTLTLTGVRSKLESPLNNTYTKINETNFNCNLSTSSAYVLSNVTFYLWNTTGLVYNTTSLISETENQTTFNFNFTNEATYFWNCFVSNNVSNTTFATNNFTITFDETRLSIQNVSVSETTSTATITFDLTEVGNASINISSNQETNSSFRFNHSLTFSGLSANTAYTYNITSCDQANNCNYSSSTFTTDSESSSGGSSGGGGGGGGGSSAATKTYSATELQLKQGYSNILKEKETLNLGLSSGKHTFTLNNIEDDSVNVTIRSNPITFFLKTGESKKLNLSSRGYFDLLIKLESIAKGNANITFKEINETIEKKILSTENFTNETSENFYTAEEDKKLNYFIYYILGFLFLVLVLLKWKSLYSKKTKKKKKKNDKRKKKAKTKTKSKR